MSILRIVALSDTHGQHEHVRLPEGDLVIHAGDFMRSGLNPLEAYWFARWLREQAGKARIVIAGNHDLLFDQRPAEALCYLGGGIQYLESSSIEFAGVKLWGSAITPEFNNWAFNRKRGAEIRRTWRKIPQDTDVLITHGPPAAILDFVDKDSHAVGCADLLARIQQVKPPLHIFGHIHASAGTRRLGETLYANAAVMDENYRVTHSPLVFDYDTEARRADQVLPDGNSSLS